VGVLGQTRRSKFVAVQNVWQNLIRFLKLKAGSVNNANVLLFHSINTYRANTRWRYLHHVARWISARAVRKSLTSSKFNVTTHVSRFRSNMAFFGLKTSYWLAKQSLNKKALCQATVEAQ